MTEQPGGGIKLHLIGSHPVKEDIVARVEGSVIPVNHQDRVFPQVVHSFHAYFLRQHAPAIPVYSQVGRDNPRRINAQ